MIVTNNEQGKPFAKTMARLFRRVMPNMIFLDQDAEGAIVISVGRDPWYIIYCDGNIARLKGAQW